jgi:hypothetical protein
VAQQPPDPWVRSTHRPPLPPAPPWWRAILEHGIIAGPILGVLSALYGFHLSQIGPLVPDYATHAVIRQAASWHGRFLHAYYITPTQNLIWWALSGPAIAWLVLMVLTMIALGVRAHHVRK